MAAHVRTVVVAEADRRELQRRARGKGRAGREVKRARIVLAAEGVPGKQIAAPVGRAEPRVVTWRRRYAESGLAGLDDRPRWLANREADGLRPATVAAYTLYVERDLVPAIGDICLGDLRPGHVEKLLRDLRAAGRGTTTVRRIHATFCSALTSAHRARLVAYNAAVDVARSVGCGGPTSTSTAGW